MNLEQLPPECLARVLTFVNSPQDLETASVASTTLASLVGEEHFWRNLTLANFDLDQMSSVHFGRPGWRDQPPATINDCNWRRAYLRLIKRYGDQHFYTAKLAVCDVCACLFWPVSHFFSLTHILRHASYIRLYEEQFAFHPTLRQGW